MNAEHVPSTRNWSPPTANRTLAYTQNVWPYVEKPYLVISAPMPLPKPQLSVAFQPPRPNHYNHALQLLHHINSNLVIWLVDVEFGSACGSARNSLPNFDSPRRLSGKIIIPTFVDLLVKEVDRNGGLLRLGCVYVSFSKGVTLRTHGADNDVLALFEVYRYALDRTEEWVSSDGYLKVITYGGHHVLTSRMVKTL
jgi:hypothetical protein